MKKITKSLMTLALISVASVVNAQDGWIELPVTGYVHEWVTNAEQTKAEKTPDADGVYKVFVRSKEAARDAGNAICTDNNNAGPLKEDFSNYAEWDSQFFITFGEENKLVQGDIVRVTMDVKADVAATIGTQSHTAPGSYLGNGVGNVIFGTEDWTAFDSGEKEVGSDPKSGAYTFALNLAKGVENNYYFKNIKVLVKKAAFNTEVNHMLLVTNNEARPNAWDYQANYKLPAALEQGKTYVFEAVINAVNGGETRVVTSVDGASPQYLVTKGLWTNQFTRYKVEFDANAAINKLEIDLGACAGDVYIDNITLVEKGKTTNLVDNGDFETQGFAWDPNPWAGQKLKQVEQAAPVEVLEPGMLISVGEAGWRTFRTGSAIKNTDSNVKAYVAKYVEEGNYVKLTETTAVPGWQPVLIEAAKGNYMVEIAKEDVSGLFPWDDNGLQANGASALPGDGTLYGLANVNGVVGFYKIASTSEVPAYAIYLKIPAATTGREFIGFANDATTIKAVETLNNSGLIYNLAGQQVKKAQKGVYIINGKKAIVK